MSFACHSYSIFPVNISIMMKTSEMGEERESEERKDDRKYAQFAFVVFFFFRYNSKKTNVIVDRMTNALCHTYNTRCHMYDSVGCPGSGSWHLNLSHPSESFTFLLLVVGANAAAAAAVVAFSLDPSQKIEKFKSGIFQYDWRRWRWCSRWVPLIKGIKITLHSI